MIIVIVINVIIILSYYISFQPDKLIVQWALYNINTYIYICIFKIDCQTGVLLL